MSLLIQTILSRKTSGAAACKDQQSKIACEVIDSRNDDINLSFRPNDTAYIAPCANENAPKPTYSYQSRSSVILSAQNALIAVRRHWNSNSNMLENGFCNQIFIPELLVLNQGMINLAVSDLGVDPGLLLEDDDGLPALHFAEFMYCLRQQRKQLSDARRQRFDEDWGITRRGQLSQSRGICGGMLINCGPFAHRSDRWLKRECLWVLEASAREEACMPEPAAAVPFTHAAVVGVKLLHLFIVDLLGRQSAAAMAFEMKAVEK